MGKIEKAADMKVERARARTDIELAIQVSDRIQLESVRLMSCESRQMRLCGPGKKSFEIKRTVSSSMDRATNRIFVMANFTLVTFEMGNTEKEPCAVIEASFLLIYQADSLEGISDAAVNQFGDINGIYNAWPYWREFVQNTIVRMGLPSLTIPVFRVFEPRRVEKPKETVTAKKKTAKKKTAKKKTARKKAARKVREHVVS